MWGNIQRNGYYGILHLVSIIVSNLYAKPFYKIFYDDIIVKNFYQYTKDFNEL